MKRAPSTLSRRALIGRAGVVALGLGSAFLPFGCTRVPKDERVRHLLDLVPGDRGLEIGTSYLRHVGRQDASRIADELIRETPVDLFAEDDVALRRWFADRVHRDFTEGRIVTVERWQLSRTEVGLCVLKALAAEGKPQMTAGHPGS